MSNAKSVEDIVNGLMKKAGVSSIKDLLAEAANEGAQIGKLEATSHLVRRLPEILQKSGILDGMEVMGPRRSKQTKGVVQCPVPNCKSPGVRPLHNFCQSHYDSIDPKKREDLRRRQLENKAKAKKEERERQLREHKALQG